MEVLVVLAIFIGLLALGLFMSLETFRGTIFRSERSTIVSLLSRARSRAMSNYFGVPWGLCYDSASPQYVLFRSAYVAGASTNETIPATPSVSIISLPAKFACSSGGVIFTQLSGTTTPVDIGIRQNARISTTTVNAEGAILW